LAHVVNITNLTSREQGGLTYSRAGKLGTWLLLAMPLGEYGLMLDRGDQRKTYCSLSTGTLAVPKMKDANHNGHKSRLHCRQGKD
jgi:hypothetical protein